jgi:hypothetical protein
MLNTISCGRDIKRIQRGRKSRKRELLLERSVM